MTTPHKAQKNPDQSLSKVNHLIQSNLDIFLKYFKCDLKSDSVKYSGCCPIHNDSDNPNAIIIYKNTGIWICNTHHCHNIFGKNAIGLIRGLLSSKKRGWLSEDDTNKVSTFNDASEFTFKLLNKSASDLVPIESNDEFIDEKKNFIRQVRLLKTGTNLGNRDYLRKQCKIPSEYYLNRGYDKDILDKYDVGIALNPKSYFYNRTIVPIYDAYHKYIVGVTARVNLEKCLVCGAFHQSNELCLDKTEVYKGCKWEHNHGFQKESTLYNYWYSKDCINDNRKVILVEGPSDVWKLEMANICYSVGIFGSNLSINQVNILKKSYIKDIWIIGDNDEAGQKACQQMERVLGTQFSFHKIELPTNDLGDMTVEDIRNIFK